MEITYHGHSTVSLIDGDVHVLIDPFLAPNNPAAVIGPDEVDPTQILVTHGHVDHLADAVAIAKRTGAPIAAVLELANWFSEHGAPEVSDPDLGGTIGFDGGWAKLVQAWHTSTAPGSADAPFSPTSGTVVGVACGWVVGLGEKTVYHLGDTALFGDLRLIAERTPVDVALVPIGGHYTMDRHDAVVAVELVGAATVIPIHYDTFPPIKADPSAFKADVESQTDSSVVVMGAGETHSL